jgi:large subunit ribosomal protein L17
MRHQRAGRKFSRTSAHRKAMFGNLVASLVLHGRIETTDAKAKVLKRLADRTISWGTSVGDLTAKQRDQLSVEERARVVHAMRMAGRMIRSGEALTKLFAEVAPRFVGRPGGYTRVLKTRVRHGDASSMSFVELVEGEAAPAATQPAPGEGGGKAAKAKAKGKAAAPAPTTPAATKARKAAKAGAPDVEDEEDAGDEKEAKKKAGAKSRKK